MKAVNIIYKIIYGLIALLFLYIIGTNLLMNRKDQYWMYYDFSVSKWILFFLSVVIAILIFFWGDRIAQKEKEENKKRYFYFLIIASVILLILQVVIVKNVFFQVGWDVSYLKDAATQYVDSNLDEFHKHYFEKNPNNILMYEITIVFVKIGKIIGFNGYKALVYFGVLLNNLSVLVTSLVVYRITRKRVWGYFSYVLAVLLFGLSPWMIAPYSDIFSVLVPVLSLYIYLVVRESKLIWFLKPILVVILPSAAYAIKPTNLFVLFAIAICELVQILKRPDRLKAFFKIIIGIIISVLIVILTRTIAYKSINYTENKNAVMPMAHYLLLGSNFDMVGQYNGYDDEYTCSFETKEEKSKADIHMVIDRYREMFPFKYINHICNKTYLNYSNGIFGWGKEAGFVKEMYENNSKVGKLLRSYYYLGGDNILIPESLFPEGGERFSYFANLSQIVWFVVLILSFVQSIKNLFVMDSERFEDSHVVIGIVLIGAFVFVSLFETNARYLFSFLPLFVVYDLVNKNENK